LLADRGTIMRISRKKDAPQKTIEMMNLFGFEKVGSNVFFNKQIGIRIDISALSSDPTILGPHIAETIYTRGERFGANELKKQLSDLLMVEK